MTSATNEQLKPNEQIRQEPEAETAADTGASLSESVISDLFAARRQQLDTVKQWISLKFFYQAAEKVKREEAALRKLLDLEQAKQTILAEYTFVLDPVYFEQKFLP
jgi:hypothetical protein